MAETNARGDGLAKEAEVAALQELLAASGHLDMRATSVVGGVGTSLII
jgi:hypothetical protein